MEHEIWFTAVLNKLLSGLVSPLLTVLRFPPRDPLHPIPNNFAMEVLVLLVVVSGALFLKSRLSVEHPSYFQHAMELVVEFTQNMNQEIIGHEGGRYVSMIACLGIFVGLCNLLGLIPTLETPTAHIQVTLGCAVMAFLYYNFHGIRHHGLLGYLKHFGGPIWWMAFL